MENKYDQLKIEYSETDNEPKSVKLMSVFLILVFAIVPLVEIVPDFEYNYKTYYSPKTTCIVGWDSFEPLNFKEIK
ncbi:MAG: hypothetical protein AB8B78_02450 [Polaribacter sp.]